MIRLYKNYNKFTKDEVLRDCESFFVIRVGPDSLNKLALDIMYNIDKAKLLDKDLGTIQTPFGITDIDHLSTGCKTVLTYLYLSEHRDKYKGIKAMDVTEAGWNALEELFKTMEIIKYDIGIILKHNNKLYNCSDREYLVDDTRKITELLDF